MANQRSHFMRKSRQGKSVSQWRLQLWQLIFRWQMLGLMFLGCIDQWSQWSAEHWQQAVTFHVMSVFLLKGDMRHCQSILSLNSLKELHFACIGLCTCSCGFASQWSPAFVDLRMFPARGRQGCLARRRIASGDSGSWVLIQWIFQSFSKGPIKGLPSLLTPPKWSHHGPKYG